MDLLTPLAEQIILDKAGTTEKHRFEQFYAVYERLCVGFADFRRSSTVELVLAGLPRDCSQLGYDDWECRTERAVNRMLINTARAKLRGLRVNGEPDFGVRRMQLLEKRANARLENEIRQQSTHRNHEVVAQLFEQSFSAPESAGSRYDDRRGAPTPYENPFLDKHEQFIQNVIGLTDFTPVQSKPHGVHATPAAYAKPALAARGPVIVSRPSNVEWARKRRGSSNTKLADAQMRMLYQLKQRGTLTYAQIAARINKAGLSPIKVTANQCREKWVIKRNIQPKKGRWSAQEDQVLIGLYKKADGNIFCVAEQMSDRTLVQIRERIKILKHKKMLRK